MKVIFKNIVQEKKNFFSYKTNNVFVCLFCGTPKKFIIKTKRAIYLKFSISYLNRQYNAFNFS